MAQRTAIALTGDDLTVADVWAVAVEREHATLSDAARVKMRAARELVGLMPAGAAAAAAGSALRIDGFDASHLLELRLL